MFSKDKKLKIIVVDDADFSRNAVVNILEEANYNVVGQASNAEEAIQLSSSTSANLFLIDVVMPEISGIELAKFISEKTTDTNIIMMSSLNTENVILDSISNGAIDYLQKPFEKETLIKAVEKIERNILADR